MTNKHKMESNAKNGKICFWDKHPFSGESVSCPILFKPTQVIRKKKEYYINQNCTRDSRESPSTSEPTLLDVNKVEHKIFYDDIFCSYSCCLAWIENNSSDRKYTNSKHLLYNEMLMKKIQIPRAANHWRVIDSFGGFMTIEKFRSCNNIYYILDNFYDTNGNMKYIFKESNFVE